MKILLLMVKMNYFRKLRPSSFFLISTFFCFTKLATQIAIRILIRIRNVGQIYMDKLTFDQRNHIHAP